MVSMFIYYDLKITYKYKIMILNKIVKSLFLILLLVFVAQAQKSAAQPQKVSGPDLLIQPDSFHAMAPKWSPDGSKLALTTHKYKGLWVVDVAGNNRSTVKLSDEPASGYRFAWNPAGSHIVARVANFDDTKRKDAIKLFGLSGRDSQLLTEYQTDAPGLPQWAGYNRVAFSSANQIKTVDAGLNIQQKARPDDNSRAFLAANNQILAISNGTDTPKPVFEMEGRRLINVTPSPDGSRIAFEVVGGDLYVVNSDGTGLTSLGQAHRPSWSPDSQYLTCMISEDDGHNYTSSDIYIISVDGSQKINLTSDSDLIATNPDWSPRGSQIAFDTPDQGAIYTITVE